MRSAAPDLVGDVRFEQLRLGRLLHDGGDAVHKQERTERHADGDRLRHVAEYGQADDREEDSGLRVIAAEDGADLLFSIMFQDTTTRTAASAASGT